MRILFYLHPLPLAQGPVFNGAWTGILHRLMRGLRDCQDVECRMVTGARFVPMTQSPVADERVTGIDEVALLAAIFAARPERPTLAEIVRLLRSDDPAGEDVRSVVAGQVQRGAGRFTPDVVITFGIRAEFLRRLWPETVILHVELSALSRNPYPSSLFFDHCGIYDTSTLATADPARMPTTKATLRLLEDVRGQKLDALARHDPFQRHGFRDRFDRLALLPLQVSNYYSFDDQSNYRTQFEFLIDVLQAAPASTGVIVSEYVQWGGVLQGRGPAGNLDWLRARFPNLIFHEAFRRFDSVSQYLLPHVDGMCTISSNLGLQALLLRKRLLTGPRSYLSRLGHDQSPAAFFGKLGQPEEAPHADRRLAWYLSHYAVPMALAEQGPWLAEYLQRRLTAIHAQHEGTDGYVPIAPVARLREHWLAPETEKPPGRFELPSARAVRLRAEHAAERFRLKVVSTVATDDLADAERPERDGFLLLNDTRELDRHLHWGCNTVTAHIEQRLRQAGWRCVGRLNHQQDCERMLASPEIDRVRIVVLNGEGSVHHDNPRIIALMRFCATLKARGVPCVLINSVWHENTESTGRLLNAFDLVTVRESFSLKAIRPWRDDARVVPDLTFATLHDQASAQAEHLRPDYELVVIDHVGLPQTQSLRTFADHQRQPFFMMGQLHVASMFQTGALDLPATGIEVPRVLEDALELRLAAACVSGRYHGLIAALCTGLPSVALMSNTPKIEGMLEDMGLGTAFVLDTNWVTQTCPEQRRQVDRLLGGWTAQARRRLARYRRMAAAEADTLWQDILALAAQGPVATAGQRRTETAADLGVDQPIGPREVRQVVPDGGLPTVATRGFHEAESWGWWCGSHDAQLLVPLQPEVLDQGCVLRVQLRAIAFEATLDRAPVLGVRVEGQEVGYAFFRHGARSRVDVAFTVQPTVSPLRIDLQFTDVIAPADVGYSDDRRPLGFGVEWLVVSCLPEADTADGARTDREPLLWGIEEAVGS